MANPNLLEAISIGSDDKQEEESEGLEEETASNGEEDDDPEEEEEVKPIGRRVRFSWKGKERRGHYEAFKFGGVQFNLEDSVLITPEDYTRLKPLVAIIKDVSQTVGGGAVTVVGQRLYRPEDAETEGGGEWPQSLDNRELFYSFDRFEFPATRVMHDCVVHFVPSDKRIPDRRQNPGFVVQKVYDAQEKRGLELRDREFEEDEKEEMELLVAKTGERLGGFLPDLETEDEQSESD